MNKYKTLQKANDCNLLYLYKYTTTMNDKIIIELCSELFVLCNGLALDFLKFVVTKLLAPAN